MSHITSIDDILNANDSDEDVETVHVDLELLLDNDSDDDSVDTPLPPKLPIYQPPEITSQTDSSDKEINDLLHALEKEALEKGVQGSGILDASLSVTLPESMQGSNIGFDTNTTEADIDPSNAVTLLSALQLADRREVRLMHSGDRDTQSALQAKISANSSSKGDTNSSNLQLSHLRCLCMETISSQLTRNSQFRQHGPGTATVVQITSKFISVGTTRGLVLLFDHSQEMRQVIGSSTPATSRNSSPVTALDVTASGDVIVCGYNNGEIIVWETVKGSVVKKISDLHTCAVVRLCIVYGVGEVAANITGVSSDYSIVSADNKGVVHKTKLSKVLFVTVSAESECLLDGSAGHIMDLCGLSPYTSQASLIKANVVPASGQLAEHLPSALPGSEQLVALNSHTRTYIIRVYPEVTILSRWAAPASVVDPKGGTVRPGFAVALDWTWALSSEYPQVKVRTLGGGSIICPMLARGWGKTLEVYACCVKSAQKASAAGVINSEAPLDFFSIGEVVLTAEIVSVRWLGANTVAVLTTKEVCVLHLPDFMVERIPLEAPVAAILTSSVESRGLDEMVKLGTAIYKQRMYLLSPDQMFMFYLQSWREQVDQLVVDGQWLDALAYVLDSYAKRGRKPNSSSSKREVAVSTGAEEVTPADMELYIRRYAELAVIRQGGGVGQVGGRRVSAAGMMAGGHHFLVAQVCIEFCVLAGGDLLEVLYEEIYRIFSAAHQQPIFIESLEPFILRRQIRDLPAKIFSDVLDYCVRSMKFSFLERCICHFDLTDIDINATVRLLLKHRLMSGFLYVYSFGLMDFAGAFQMTFEYMMSMPFVPGTTVSDYDFPTPEQADMGYKLLLFIQYVATGRVFPRGESTVISSACLFELVRAIASPVELPSIPSAPRTITASVDVLALSNDSVVQFPYLLALAKVDYYALFYCLQLAFRELYSQGSGVGVENQQKSDISQLHNSFGDLIFSVLEFAKYGDSQMRMQSSYQLCYFKHFLDLLVSVHTPLPEILVEDIISHCRLHVKPYLEAEKRIVSLVTAQCKICTFPGSFVHALERNGFYRPALQLYGLKVRSTSHTLTNALRSYVTDRNEDFRRQVFPYVQEFIAGMTASVDGAPTDSVAETRQTECRQVLVEHIEELAGIDLLETKRLTVMYLSPTQISAIISKTQKHQKLQFELLDAVVRGLESTASTVADEHPEEGGAGAPPAGGLTGDEDALSAHEMLVYVTQLATFRPEELHAFLSTHNNYPLDETLKVSRSKGIFDATAFLLERAGDSMGALDLCLKEISTALSATQKEVETLVRAQCSEGNLVGKRSGTFRRGSKSTLSGQQGGTSGGTTVDVMQIVRAASHHQPGAAHGHSARNVVEPLNVIPAYRNFMKAVALSTGVCSRHDSKSSSTHWFSVLDYLLKEKYAIMGTNMTTRNSLEGLSSGSAVDEFSRDIMGLVVGCALKDFMGHMSSHVPSQDIVRRITQEQMIGSRFAEFKDVMISMVDSYSHEINLYQTFLRINTADILRLRAQRMKQKHRGVRYSGNTQHVNGTTSNGLNISEQKDEDVTADKVAAGGKKVTAPMRTIGNSKTVIDRFKANQRMVAPVPSATGQGVAVPYRSAVSTALPVQRPSIDLSMTARRPGSLPVQAKFEAVYGY